MAEQGKEINKFSGAVSQITAGGKQKIVPTIDKFYNILEQQYVGVFRMNEMTGKREFKRGDEWNEWSDSIDSLLRHWFQTEHSLYSKNMLDDALNVFFSNHRANPLIDMLESIKWDGQERIGNFLTFVLKCPDDSYHQEVSRLIFAGGVWRAYKPGCKFDDMAVLIGRQGGGKSALVRWLNMDDTYFREIKTISGKEGIEILRGAWIAEVAELMAMTRVKETEAVKAYITTQCDSYRAPYDRHTQEIPRRCTFVGTTNNPNFLTDRTGNRRFYPVKSAADGYDIFDHEQEIRDYIRLCWAEAVAKYKAGSMPPFASRSLLNVIHEAQEDAMEDDWRVGAIAQYLEDMKRADNSTVSVIELWHCALGEPEESKPARKDSIEISQIMNSMEGWEKVSKAVRTSRWGVQRIFRKKPRFYPF